MFKTSDERYIVLAHVCLFEKFSPLNGTTSLGVSVGIHQDDWDVILYGKDIERFVDAMRTFLGGENE